MAFPSQLHLLFKQRAFRSAALLQALIFAAILTFCVIPHPAVAQSSASSTPALFNGPPGLVEFNHHTLFQLQTIGFINGQDRAELASDRLQAAWQANSSHGTEEYPHNDSVVSEPSGPAIVINGIRILNVSPADASAAGVSDIQLAQTWKGTIESAFRSEIREKNPEYLKTELTQTALALGLGLCFIIIVLYVKLRFKTKSMAAVYFAIAFYVMHSVVNVLPAVRTVFYDIWLGPGRPILMIIYVAVPAAAIARIWSAFLHAIVPPLPEHISSQDLVRRTNLRRRTLAGIAEVTGASLVWVFAIVTALGWYGFNPSALLTSAGLIGVAIGLVAQDAIRDTLAGIYILADDRYGVGDSIKIGDYEGRVERFNLRMTQIRDMSGRLITLSNRNTTEVANLTARWAQVDFRVGVSYYDDLNQALSVLEATANSLKQEWPDRIIDDVEVIGVESFNDTNITLRLIVKTAPGDQSMVAHELRKRVKAAFDNEKIAMLNDQYKSLHPD